MRTIPLLATMDVTDLTQRYAQSYVMYNGKVTSCEGFICNDDGQVHIGTSGGWVKFDWKLLNTYRPPSRWYWHKTYGYFYFRYLAQRQYCRGFSSSNVSITNPHNQYTIDSTFVTEIFKQEGNKVQRKSLEDVWKSVAVTRGCIVTEHFLFTEKTIWYRHLRVGEIEDQQLFFPNKTFAQEMKDLGYPCNFQLPPKKTPAELFRDLKEGKGF